MLTDFFLQLKSGGVPVSVKEYLMLVEALAKGVADYLSRAALVKDESNYYKFDLVRA